MGKLSFIETTTKTYTVDVGDDFDYNTQTQYEWVTLKENIVDGDPDEISHDTMWIMDGMIIK